MSAFDLHPEELLDRVRRGQASAEERERVHQHLQSCEACRFEQALFAQSARDAAPHPGDGARARRIEQAAAAVLAARGVIAPNAMLIDGIAPALRGGAIGRGRRRASALLVGAVVSSLATAAAAAVLTQPAWLARVMPGQSAPAPAGAESAAKRARRARAEVVRSPAPRAPVPNPAPAMVEPSPAVMPAAPWPATRAGAVRSAAELFAAANLARRERETATAVRLYRELVRRHPRSAEAAVSRVALGRLLLDRLGDARSALREFDAYLADPTERALREDALIGRGLALGRLGRAREEQAAWQALLAAFPSSAYAERAGARLQELRCALGPC